MDKYDTFVLKINAVDRFNHGAVKLENEDVALTGLFTNFLRYLLDDWVVGPPIPPERATEMAKTVIRRLTMGMQYPSHDRVRDIAEGPDGDVLPLLAVRWLMRNAEIKVLTPHLGQEWREFVRHYGHVIAALDSNLFSFRDL
jgi:hypothetical protein